MTNKVCPETENCVKPTWCFRINPISIYCSLKQKLRRQKKQLPRLVNIWKVQIDLSRKQWLQVEVEHDVFILLLYFIKSNLNLESLFYGHSLRVNLGNPISSLSSLAIKYLCRLIIMVISTWLDKDYRDVYQKTERTRLEWEACMSKCCQVCMYTYLLWKHAHHSIQSLFVFLTVILFAFCLNRHVKN